MRCHHFVTPSIAISSINFTSRMNSSVAVPTNEVEADLNDKGVRMEGEQVEVIETAAETKTEGRVEEKSIEESSHWFSRALLLYLNPLFEKGARQPLEQSHLRPLILLLEPLAEAGVVK